MLTLMLTITLLFFSQTKDIAIIYYFLYIPVFLLDVVILFGLNTYYCGSSNADASRKQKGD